MLKKIGHILLLSALLSLSSCGSETEDVAIITLLVTVSQGNIAEIVYLDGDGQEVQTTGTAGRRTFTATFPAKEGTFLYLSAAAELGGDSVNISGRILSNGQVVNEVDNDGENGPPATRPQVLIDGFAIIPQEEAVQ